MFEIRSDFNKVITSLFSDVMITDTSVLSKLSLSLLFSSKKDIWFFDAISNEAAFSISISSIIFAVINFESPFLIRSINLLNNVSKS